MLMLSAETLNTTKGKHRMARKLIPTNYAAMTDDELVSIIATCCHNAAKKVTSARAFLPEVLERLTHNAPLAIAIENAWDRIGSSALESAKVEYYERYNKDAWAR